MWVLPALVYRLQAVTVRIENIRGIVTRVVVKAGTWLTVVYRPRSHCCYVEGIDFLLVSGNEADMRCTGICAALAKPEKNPPVNSRSPSNPDVPLGLPNRRSRLRDGCQGVPGPFRKIGLNDPRL